MNAMQFNLNTMTDHPSSPGGLFDFLHKEFTVHRTAETSAQVLYQEVNIETDCHLCRYSFNNMLSHSRVLFNMLQGLGWLIKGAPNGQRVAPQMDKERPRTGLRVKVR